MQDRIVLAVDTLTSVPSFALARNQEILECLVSELHLPHSQTFFSLLTRLLHRGGLDPRNIGVFAVVTGLGSFIGLRVGLAAVKGLSQALNSIILEVNALDLIMLDVKRPGKYLVLLELGKENVFAGIREIGNDNRLYKTLPDQNGSMQLVTAKFAQAIEEGAAIIRVNRTMVFSRDSNDEIELDAKWDDHFRNSPSISIIQTLNACSLVNTLALYADSYFSSNNHLES